MKKLGWIGMILLAIALVGSWNNEVIEPAPVVAEYKPWGPEQRAAYCHDLYDVGRSVEWQNCMGVGPK